MQQIEVFADVGCPFTHAGLRAVVAIRDERGTTEPHLRVRAWPLEIVNGEPTSGSFLAPEIAALQEGPAPELFTGFDATTFPATTRPAMASTAAAYRAGPDIGEAFALAVRDALWEHGRDIADPAVLAELRAELACPTPCQRTMPRSTPISPRVAGAASVALPTSSRAAATSSARRSTSVMTMTGAWWCASTPRASVASCMQPSTERQRQVPCPRVCPILRPVPPRPPTQ